MRKKYGWISTSGIKFVIRKWARVEDRSWKHAWYICVTGFKDSKLDEEDYRFLQSHFYKDYSSSSFYDNLMCTKNLGNAFKTKSMLSLPGYYKTRSDARFVVTMAKSMSKLRCEV